jgi:hypothetical protein
VEIAGRRQLPVPAHFPAQVFSAGFFENVARVRWIDGNVMLETLSADVSHQILEPRNFRHGTLAEGG